MKLLTKLFLCLSFLLLSGNAGMYASPDQASAEQAFINTLQNPANAGLNFLHNDQVNIARSYDDRSEETYRLKATEVKEVEEDDDDDDKKELGFLKKHQHALAYLSTFIHPHTTGHLLPDTKPIPGFPEHFFYTSSLRYLIFCVIRI